MKNYKQSDRKKTATSFSQLEIADLVDEQNSVTVTLDCLVSSSFASKLWSRNSNLWPKQSTGAEPSEKTLGWLDLPHKLSTLADHFASLHEKVLADGFTDIVLIGMGVSSMTTLAVKV